MQWALDPKVISDLKAPVSVPLPNGTPNIPATNKDMLNPVLETFLQLPYPCRRGRRRQATPVWDAINMPRRQRSASSNRLTRRATASCSDAHRRCRRMRLSATTRGICWLVMFAESWPSPINDVGIVRSVMRTMRWRAAKSILRNCSGSRRKGTKIFLGTAPIDCLTIQRLGPKFRRHPCWTRRSQ